MENLWTAGADAPKVDGVRARRVWMSPAAIVAELKVAEGEAPSDRHRHAIARILRVLHDCCEQLEQPLPVVGLVCAPVEWRQRIEEWRGDQAWHRGDFIVEHVASEDPAALAARYAGRVDAAAFDAAPGEPRPDRATYARRLRDRVAGEDDRTASLLDAVAADVETGRIGARIDAWATAVLKEADDALQGGRP
jgi:hypothetical protein